MNEELEYIPVGSLLAGLSARAWRARVALGRTNYLFIGSVGGGNATAIAYTLIETAKMNSVGIEAWLMWVLKCLPDHKITQISELMSWVWHANSGERRKQ